MPETRDPHDAARLEARANGRAADTATHASTRASWHTGAQNQATHRVLPTPFFVQQACDCRDGGTFPPSQSRSPPVQVLDAVCRRTFSIACALRFDIPANCVSRDIPGGADEIGTCPK